MPDEVYERALEIFEEAARLVDEAEAQLPEEATDEDRKQARRRARNARLVNIAQINDANDNQAVKALWTEMQRRRERYIRNLSNKLMSSPDPVDQREIDFQRGIWYGAVLALVALPREAQDALQARDEEDEEADA